MNKKIVYALLLALFSVSAAYAQYARTVLTETETQAINQSAQEANQAQMQALDKETELKNQKKQVIKGMIDGWHNFVMLNGAFSTSPDYNFGITYARVSKVGFYVNAMTNFNGRFSADDTFYDRNLFSGSSDWYTIPFYSGNKEITRLSASAGIVVCLGIPLYAYAGAGYGFRGIYYETVDGKWIQYRNAHRAVCELGLIGQYKGISLSVAVSWTGEDYYDGNSCLEAKIGIGYCFKDKKK